MLLFVEILGFRIIGSELHAKEAFAGGSWHVSDASSRDPVVHAIFQAADIAGDLQLLQGKLVGVLISIGCANIIAITERNLENWSLAGGHLRMENGGREMSLRVFFYI